MSRDEQRPTTTACMDCGTTDGIHDTNCATHERHDRATIIDEMARTVAPMEWRGGGHMRYAGHTITWGEYVTRRHEIEDEEEWPEDRADAIGQNGPTGDHYDYTKAPCGECVFEPNYWEDVRCVHCGKKPPSDHYAEDSDIESPMSRAMRELNPATSSLTYSQAEDAARETGICSDGSPCGSPHNPDDDQYCIGCPNEAGEIAHDCPRCGGEWWSPPHSYCPCENAADAAPITADDILDSARKHMQDRAATYDKPEGERSMNSTVLAFSAITGIGMTEEQGWLFMQLLKAVRSQQGAYRADSYEDGAAYMALAGEAAAKERL